MRVYEVGIGSIGDEQLRDRYFTATGQRGLWVYRLPVRAQYIIEARDILTAQKKALGLAATDGIGGAIVKFFEVL
jgi:hypothetical protein